jgi:DNA repair exonuclease SbcCD ATPase subunit
MLSKIKTELYLRRGKFNFLSEEIEKTEENISILKNSLDISKSALEIIQTVAQQTQQKIEYHISNLITSCIKNLGKNYNFICNFVVRREKTECDMYLTNSEGERLDPYDEVGGSIVQVIDFALRCSLWSLQKNEVNDFLFLDEPFSGVKKNLYKKLSNILKEVSNKRNLQLIIISHDNELAELGDRVFYLKKEGKNIIVDETNQDD